MLLFIHTSTEQAMPKFTIACFWTVSGKHEVEADTEQEAIQKATDLPLPTIDVDYLEDSLSCEVEAPFTFPKINNG
jgi:hypothetical protein